MTVETAAQIVTAVRELYAHRETLADTTPPTCITDKDAT